MTQMCKYFNSQEEPTHWNKNQSFPERIPRIPKRLDIDERKIIYEPWISEKRRKTDRKWNDPRAVDKAAIICYLVVEALFPPWINSPTPPMPLHCFHRIRKRRILLFQSSDRRARYKLFIGSRRYASSSPTSLFHFHSPTRGIFPRLRN